MDPEKFFFFFWYDGWFGGLIDGSRGFLQKCFCPKFVDGHGLAIFLDGPRDVLAKFCGFFTW